VPPANAKLIADAIGPTATLRYFERSGHAMTVDVDHEEIYKLITDFFVSVGDTSARASAPSASSAV